MNDSEDASAWTDFVNRFRPRLVAQFRRMGLQDADAEDMTSDLLRRFHERKTFQRFVFQGKDKFGRWMRVIARRAAISHARAAKSRIGSWSLGHPDAQAALYQATDQWAADVTDGYSDDLALGAEVYAAVAARVAPATMQAFHLTALDGLPGKVVAERLGLSVPSVFTARARVAKMLMAELQLRQKV